MKVLLFVISFCIVSASFATEVETNCPAMNENREKNIKVAKPRAISKKGNTIQ
jgi:hypothetical protein